jgi:hypothetical protein
LREESHYNIIIINKNNNNIEYFEPLKKLEFNIPFFKYTSHILGIIHSLFNYKLKESKFKWIDSHSTCPIGLQNKQELIFKYNNNKKVHGPRLKNNKMYNKYGLCVAWCLLCIHLRILNPDLNIIHIINNVLHKNSPKQLNSFILKYIHKIETTNLPNLLENTIFEHFNLILTKDELHINEKNLQKAIEHKDDNIIKLFKNFQFYKQYQTTEIDQWNDEIINSLFSKKKKI